MRLAWIVRLAVLAATLCVSLHALADPMQEPSPPTPADALTSALVAMGQAEVGGEVLKAWLLQQGEIPRLTGEQLARLKTAGLADDVLLHLVRGAAAPLPVVEGIAPPPQIAETPPPPAESAAAPAGSGSRIRVLVQSVPSVDYCELALDGKLIATRGRLFEGEVPAGSYAPRSKALPLRKPTVLFEGEVAPGRHMVNTGFLISRLQEEFGDLRLGGRRQRVLSEGIRALDVEEDAAAGTVCTVEPGEVCEVTARFRRVDPGLPGGRVDYGVSYDTRVLTEGAVPEEIQAASWAAGAGGR